MDPATIATLPKVVLHEHLDGGLRPATMIELAQDVGYTGLPEDEPSKLAAWFPQAVKTGGLPGYLSTFEHTIALLQTAAALERAAYESGADLAAEGVVYAEVRFAPELNTRAGLALDDVIEAALAGFARASADHPIEIGLIVDGMRNGDRTRAAAEAAVRWAGEGRVVGYDIAGPEAGFPAAAHRDAFDAARRAGLGITIHAGEAFGPASIAEALHECGAQRIGHGIRIDDQIYGNRLGALAVELRDRQVPLEICPSSNVDTGAVASLADHPVDRLLRFGFAVTLNCDNRLMSGTGPNREAELMAATFDWGIEQFEQVTLTAAAAAFVSEDHRRRLVEDRIRPVYDRLRRSLLR